MNNFDKRLFVWDLFSLKLCLGLFPNFPNPSLILLSSPINQAQNPSSPSPSLARFSLFLNNRRCQAITCTGRKVENILQNLLESMKNYNSNFNYNREKTLKLRSSLCLRLGSLRSSGKWILFSIDRVNVKLFWNFSPWITDGVAQLLSNEISKRLR